MYSFECLRLVGLWVGEYKAETYGAQELNQPCQILTLKGCNAIAVPLADKEAPQAVGELGRGLVEIPKLVEEIRRWRVGRHSAGRLCPGMQVAGKLLYSSQLGLW